MAGEWQRAAPGIRRRAGTREFQLRVSAKRPDGTFSEVTRMFSGTLAEAKRARGSFMNEVASEARAPSPKTATLSEQLADYIDLKLSQGASPNTVATYETMKRVHIDPALGQITLAKLTTRDLDTLYAAKTSRVAEKIAVLIGAALEQARRWKLVRENVARDTTRPKIKKSKINVPDRKAMEKLLAVAEERDPMFARLFRVAAATGARRGELCGLRWSDIDFEAGTLSIERAVRTPGGISIGPTKTDESRRVVPLGAATLEVLREHEREAKAAAEAVNVTLGSESYVWSRRPGGDMPPHPSSVSHSFKKVCDAAGVKATWHTATRHAMATGLLAAGMDVRTIQSRGGWTNPSVLLSTYAHAVTDREREAAELIDGLLE